MNPASSYIQLATRTANCLLGIDCNETASASASASAASSGTVIDKGIGIGMGIGTNEHRGNVADASSAPTTAEDQHKLEKIGEEVNQMTMNQNSKGSYFLIFMLFLLLLGFSLDKEEEE